MAINSGFTQKVEVFNRFSAWSEIYVSGLSINESLDNPIPEIKFDFYGDNINSSRINVIDTLQGYPLRVTQEVNGKSITFYCVLASVEAMRIDHYDVYKMKYYGQEELMTRRKFFYAFNKRDATGVIKEIINIYNENCPSDEQLTKSGIENNSQYVGKLVSNYESAFEMIMKICKITGWVFKVENGDCKFFDPSTRTGDFNIIYNQNCIKDTLKVSADRKGIINVAVGEAWVYEDINIEQTYEECLETIFIDQYDSDIYEVVDPFKIIQPEEFSETKSKINLDDGTITFENPLVFDVEGDIDDSRPKKDINLVGKMRIRRRVLARAQNDVSISNYGERFSSIQKNDSGEDLETVFAKLESIVQQRAFPVVSGECDITEFGLRAGDFIDVSTGTRNPLGEFVAGSQYNFTARVTEIDHSTYKNEIRVRVKFSNAFFSGNDEMLSLENRVSRLEKDVFDITRLSGEVIRETGYLFKPPLVEVNEDINWSEDSTSEDSEYRPIFETGMQIDFDLN